MGWLLHGFIKLPAPLIQSHDAHHSLISSSLCPETCFFIICCSYSASIMALPKLTLISKSFVHYRVGKGLCCKHLGFITRLIDLISGIRFGSKIFDLWVPSRKPLAAQSWSTCHLFAGADLGYQLLVATQHSKYGPQLSVNCCSF